MSFLTYAQNFEDVLLWRALSDVGPGRYLDIGACDPIHDSVSHAFYQAGWRGVHVEPTPAYASRLREARPDEVVIQAAVTDAPGPIEFYEIADTGLSTGKSSIAETHRKQGYEARRVVVPTIRLDHLLGLSDDDIHWMKIDVEGMEGDVLRSWGTSDRRPWVLVIEATFPNSQKQSHRQWIGDVLRRGYREVHFDGLSRFFLHEAHKSLGVRFASPPNVFDQFLISPNHFAAGEMARTCDDRLEAEKAQAAQRETHLSREIGQARDEARADADRAITNLEAATQHHDAALAEAAAEAGRWRIDASAASERLIAAEREHREAVDLLWRDRHAAEAELRREASKSQIIVEATLRAEHDQTLSVTRSEAADTQRAHEATVTELQRSLREAHAAAKDARAQQAAALQQLVGAGQKHHDELADLNLERRADAAALRHEIREARTRLQAAIDESWKNKESAAVESFRLQQRILELESLLGQAEAESRKNAASAATERAHLQQRSVELERLLAEAREESEAIAASAAAEAERLGERIAELNDLIAEANETSRQTSERLISELNITADEREQIRAHAAEAQAEATWLISQYRVIAEEADALIRAAVAGRPGRWRRLGEALGLADSEPAQRALLSWSMPVAERQLNTSTNLVNTSTNLALESVSAMLSTAPPPCRNPYLRADSLAELLSWHDADFVRCAYVTVLGRQPDPGGEAHYTNKIRRGHPKMQILSYLRRSAEGRLHDPGIRGFDAALTKAARARLAIVGALLPDSNFEPQRKALKPFRAMANQLSVIDSRLTGGLAEVMQLGQEMSRLSVEVGRATTAPITRIPTVANRPEPNGLVTIEQILEQFGDQANA